MRSYYVYIMASLSRVLYVGVTNHLERRAYQHRNGAGSAFAAKYRVNRLVHVEETSDVRAAIAREKQIKGWLRAKKIALIESMKPDWLDLSAEWYAEGETR